MDKPSFLLQDTIDRLPIDDDAIPAAQQHPQSPIPKGGALLNPLAQPLRPRRVSCFPAPRPLEAMQPGAAHSKHLTAPPL